VLQEIQNAFGYVQEESVNWFSARTNIPASKFYGVITFYSQFHMTPRGKNIIHRLFGDGLPRQGGIQDHLADP